MPAARLTDLSGRAAVVWSRGRTCRAGEAIGLARSGATVVVNRHGLQAIDASTFSTRSPAGNQGRRRGHQYQSASPPPMRSSPPPKRQRLDILVNNADHPRPDAVQLDRRDWDAVIAVHLRGHFLLTRNAATHLARNSAKGRQGGLGVRAHHQPPRRRGCPARRDRPTMVRAKPVSRR